jgi:hypothetical protein
VNQVYLNGFYASCSYPECVYTSPNVAATRSSVQFDQYMAVAMLGVWKDCNDDGYIGLEEQGLTEYRSEVLAAWPGVGDSICPVTPTPIDPLTGKPPAGWFPSHNDGQWVRELLPIGWLNEASVVGDANAWNVNDQNARVWVDGGLPEDHVGGSGGCFIYPQPAQTFRSTGGLLWSADCFIGYRFTDTFDSVADSNAALQPYSFSDHPRDQYDSASQLDQPNPWGNEKDASDAQVWDCSQPHTTLVKESDTTYVNLSQPKVPPSVTPGGSPAGTANATGAGLDDCDRSANQDGYTHAGNALAHAPYTLEGTVTDSSVKIGTSDLAPSESQRPAAPWAAVLGKSTPPSLGLDDDTADGIWVQNTITIGPPTDTSYTTFYAYVTPTSSLALPKGTTTGSYGAENCGSFTTGVHGGWDCDATHWYKDATGRDAQPRSARLGPAPGYTMDQCTGQNGATQLPNACASFAAFPGSAYDLRDIDCVDQDVGAARDAGIVPGNAAHNLVNTAQNAPQVPPCAYAS